MYDEYSKNIEHTISENFWFRISRKVTDDWFCLGSLLSEASWKIGTSSKCWHVTDVSLEVFSRFFGRSKTADTTVYTAPTYATMKLHFRKSNRENRWVGASSQLHCLYERANNGTTHFLCEYILTIASRSRTCRQANTYDWRARISARKIDTSLLDLRCFFPHIVSIDAPLPINLFHLLEQSSISSKINRYSTFCEE